MNALLIAMVCLVGLLVPSLVAASDAACDDPRVLRFALIPKTNAQKQQQEFRPLQVELEKALQRRVDITTAPSYGAVIEGLLNDSIDLAELGPASYAMLLDRKASVSPFAALSSTGPTGANVLGTYRSILIVRSGRGLAGVSDLRNKSLSLTDPASTSGNLVPRRFIQQQMGQSIGSYFGRITFAGSHDRSIEAVRKGMVAAGFVSRTRYDEALTAGRVGPDDLAVLWQSEPLPPDPFVLRNRLCKTVVEKIHRVFFNTEPLRAMLRARGAERFIPVTNADYQVIREMFSER
ncbi:MULTISPECIES: phosphate/phosphite/phosphonate ABC transporter substrate-binding protein [unclassified Acidovorax]|jgi:phosphonate transport system substrate-binding protein|uniref:phosphate/phosphite/phosphonate ABC transporter substrate-binding protein n=1 Tax=unclassified Acidovorax TaxID=2684926 RepID=UPI0025BEF929|nr:MULTISPECIES: phosphate/phosphite/phosphonate ABC transporter substrate-binding protein [unclassified Acidovorax]HQS20946.1 phosphate/phosphite/phosphonate ABC transporter substrate-binding protein [Acidovorax defluvii]HQT16999.1 phosphate/phosphite/phosphonate ABC transporter substrate-binding protein [Acidovorax defluvii]HQT49045.1 phosphate/phosphite/phosphonate ABC transporter substrate-binding protein [Acidovorax defluvii]